MAYADVPPEIVHHVFSLGATNDRSFCLTLTLVSSWARRIALRHLLETVIITNHAQNAAFCAFLASPLQDAPGLLVRNLYSLAVSDRILSILAACPNIRRLALSYSHFQWLTRCDSDAAASLFLRTQPPVGQLPFELRLLTSPTMWSMTRGSPLPRITHLRIPEFTLAYTVGGFFTTYFPNLTHLAVPFGCLPLEDYTRLLLDLSRLRVIILIIWTNRTTDDQRKLAYRWCADLRHTDTRVMLVDDTYAYPPEFGGWVVWEEDGRADMSIWDRASA
ncbi:hypothetical protein PLICRDRAFT_274319 [Plicaturopsis crispa FD-325 SS-3]|nr:hypothetical protein PLICRDRAFT_274319 [Plicaturopsis crispa FD-325 SS-3]